MSEAAIRTEIYNILSGIADNGKVYDYERNAVDMSAFINFFKDEHGRILGWEIGRKAAPARYDDNAEEATTHQFYIRGYMGLQDAAATEKLFNAKVEGIRERFRFNFNLNNACELAGPVSVEVIDVRMFGSVLCHYCELSLPAQEVYSQ